MTKATQERVIVLAMDADRDARLESVGQGQDVQSRDENRQSSSKEFLQVNHNKPGRFGELEVQVDGNRELKLKKRQG